MLSLLRLTPSNTISTLENGCVHLPCLLGAYSPPSTHTFLLSPTGSCRGSLFAGLAACLWISSAKLTELAISAAGGVARGCSLENFGIGKKRGGAGRRRGRESDKPRDPWMAWQRLPAFVFCRAWGTHTATVSWAGFIPSLQFLWSFRFLHGHITGTRFKMFLACKFCSRWRVKWTTDRLSWCPLSWLWDGLCMLGLPDSCLPLDLPRSHGDLASLLPFPSFCFWHISMWLANARLQITQGFLHPKRKILLFFPLV